MKTRPMFFVIPALCASITFSHVIEASAEGFFERLRERIQERRSEKASPGTNSNTFYLTHDGLKRKYIVHLPPSYNKNKPTPVVLMLHGGGGSAENVGRRFGINSKSDEEGFIAVAPEGYGTGKKHYWNTGNCDGVTGKNCGGPAYKRGTDDVGYIKKVLADLKSRYNVNEKRIYATGMSAGGMMAHRLACELSDQIAAIAPVGGTITLPLAECNPKRAVGVLQFLSRNEENAPYEGGHGKCTKQGASYVSVEETINLWKELNHCIGQPKITYQNGLVHCESYKSCRQGAEVTLCTTEPDPDNWKKGGHSWPNGEVNKMCLSEQNTKCPCIPTQDIDATDYIWEFFKNKTLK